jgi:hypothetical protein
MNDEFRSPPDLSGGVDFSEFHPTRGDHNIFQCYRGYYPGGRRRHASHVWQYITKPWLRTVTFCKIGLHRRAQWHTGPGAKEGPGWTWVGCADCGKPLSERQRT